MFTVAMRDDPLGATQVMDPMVPRIGRVNRRRRDGPDVWTLDIRMESEPAIDFAPGQFNMITVFGVGEAAISLSGDPSLRDRNIHTIRAVGPVSTALAGLRPGDAVGMRGPFGHGWPLAEATGHDVIVVAGGLGLAPLRPALLRLLAERDRYGKIVLLYGARSPKDVLFSREIESWRLRPDIDVVVTVDHAIGEWHGNVGVVTTFIRRVALDPSQAIALVCGPEVMMRFAAAALHDAGIDHGSIYLSVERNMKCAIGLCGHCQLGAAFVCRDGPIFPYDRLRGLLSVKEL